MSKRRKNDSIDVKGNRKVDILGWLLVILALGLNFIIIFKGTRAFIHSDGATVITYAMEQISQRKLYPDGWWYGTDIWDFGLNTLIVPFLKLCTHWIDARACAVMVQTMCIIPITLWMKRQELLREKVWIVVLFFLVPVSEVVSEHWYFQATYMTLCLVLAVMILSVSMILSQNKKESILGTVILLLLLFFKIGAGYMLLLVFALPMLLTMLLQAVKENHKGNKQEIYKYLRAAGILTIGILIGVLYNKYLLSVLNTNMSATSGYGFVNYQSVSTGVLNVIINFSRLFGVADKEGVLLSLGGINKALAFVYCVGMLGFIPFMLIKKFNKLKNEFQRIFLLYSFISSFAVLYLHVFAGMPQSRYLIWIYFYSIIWLGIWVDNYSIMKFEYEKEIKIGLAAFSVVFIGGVYTYYLTYDYENNPDSLGVNNVYVDYKVDRELLEYLEENNYTYGYSTYWFAHSNYVASDGKIKMSAVTPDWKQPYYWLTSEKWFQEVQEGECFLLVPSAQYAVVPEVYKNKAIKREIFHDHVIYIYEDFATMQEIWNSLSEEVAEEE